MLQKMLCITSTTALMALLMICTHVIDEHGINLIANDSTSLYTQYDRNTANLVLDRIISCSVNQASYSNIFYLSNFIINLFNRIFTHSGVSLLDRGLTFIPTVSSFPLR
jgi:hypothetical protein